MKGAKSAPDRSAEYAAFVPKRIAKPLDFSNDRSPPLKKVQPST
jgi:hypothetical protein